MKKRILAVVLLLCMLLPGLSAEGFAAETQTAVQDVPIRVTASVDEQKIRAQDVAGDLYLFLPSTADLTNLKLSFRKSGETTTANEIVNVPALIQKDSKGRYPLKTVLADGSTVRFYVMQGSAIPTMYLTSANAEQGRTWVDTKKKNEATGEMKLIASDGAAVYDGGLTQIKARGNSTFTYYPKKAYQIKLSEKSDLLGNGEKVKTWVLLANYGDATLMHDKLFKDLATQLGMPYTVSCDWVNLYYDGEYRGVYLLSEKNSVGGTGVDITDMEEAYEDVNPTYGEDMVISEGVNTYGQKYLYTENLTEISELKGGWLIELMLQKVDEPNGFYTEKGVGVNVRSPEYAGKAAMEYISAYFQDFERAVYATDQSGNYTGVNAATGKSFDEYMDMTSLIQTFLLQELALNPDGFISSLYFYKDVDGILSAGPIWDQDMTLGTGWTIYISSGVQDYHYLAEGLVKIPAFYDAMVCYFYDTFLPAAEKWLGAEGVIQKHAALLADSAAMNYVLWPYVRVGSPSADNHLWAAGTDYAAVTTDAENWVARRLNVLKNTFPKPEPPAEPENNNFSDIKGHWAENSINYVIEKGLFSGTDKGFEPELPMNRAMLVTILHRLAGAPVSGKANFTDVPANAWYSGAVSWASENGIVTGYHDGRFGADDPITREQLATILWRYAKSKAINVAVGEDTNILSYEDAFDISDYAFPALQWACGEGLISGTPGGYLEPQGGATRAQAATILERFMKKSE